jgi:predicted HicB family RNase H-like nuclease
MTNINIEMPDDVHKKAKILAAMEGITLKQLINKAVIEKLKKSNLK